MENSTGIQAHDVSLSLLDDISSSNELNKHVYFSLKKVKKKTNKKKAIHTRQQYESSHNFLSTHTNWGGLFLTESDFS